MSRAKKSAEEIEEAKLLGKALAALRVSRGLTQRQVAELAGLNPQRICKAERGQFYPWHSHLKRRASLAAHVEAMGNQDGRAGRTEESEVDDGRDQEAVVYGESEESRDGRGAKDPKAVPGVVNQALPERLPP
jgi:transcriptional regulator with XRE-family HTH domain